MGGGPTADKNEINERHEIADAGIWNERKKKQTKVLEKLGRHLWRKMTRRPTASVTPPQIDGKGDLQSKNPRGEMSFLTVGLFVDKRFAFKYTAEAACEQI